jgi:thioredoxin 1
MLYVKFIVQYKLRSDDMANVLKIDEQNFENSVLNSNKPVLVDFWAEWCGPCKALGPVLEEIATELGEKATVAKVNVDEASALAQKFGIRSIPTMIFFKGGEVKGTLIGLQPKAEIVKSLNELM